jgi:hypothetical protein
VWGFAKLTGRPIHPSLKEVYDWPHTITTVCALRQKYDGFLELSEPPPIEWWDFPRYIQLHLEKLYPNMKEKKQHLEIDLDDVE